jgi:hypothetical protein
LSNADGKAKRVLSYQAPGRNERASNGLTVAIAVALTVVGVGLLLGYSGWSADVGPVEQRRLAVPGLLIAFGGSIAFVILIIAAKSVRQR